MQKILSLIVGSVIVLSGSAFAQDKDAMAKKGAMSATKSHKAMMKKGHMKAKMSKIGAMKGHMTPMKSHMGAMKGHPKAKMSHMKKKPMMKKDDMKKGG